MEPSLRSQIAIKFGLALILCLNSLTPVTHFRQACPRETAGLERFLQRGGGSK
jgi:hypothetical protein